MEVLREVGALRRWRAGLEPGRRVAFVPTMGYLHEGHLSLLRRGRELVGPEGAVVLSIFVNPTQFAPGEDLDRYPRDEAGDLAKARELGVDMAFCPLDLRELYPRGLDGPRTWVVVEGLSEGLCGRSRPTHFRGVATVVAKLWGLVRPDYGIFGRKDYQQLAVIRRMHAELFLCGEVVGAPIVREPDGLAMSSRNAYLDRQARSDALAIRRFLGEVEARFAAGERESEALLRDHAAALAPGWMDYVELVNAETLAPVDRVEAPAVCAVAVRFGDTRLLDNLELDPGRAVDPS